VVASVVVDDPHIHADLGTDPLGVHFDADGLKAR